MKVKDFPYVRFELNEGKEAFEKFEQAMKNARSVDDVLKARDEFLSVYEKYSTNGSLAYTRYTLNTHDEFYLKEQMYYDEIGPQLAIYLVKYADLMLSSSFRADLEKVLPETIFPNFECEKKCHSEAIVEDEQEENSIITEYSQLMSQITTEWKGEQKPLSFIRGFLEDKDRNVRREAALSIDKLLSEHQTQLDDIYDRLVKVRTRMAKKLGYDNYIEMGYYRMGRIDYNRDMVETFRANVKNDLVPIVSKFKKETAEALGIEDFKFYDNDVIEGEGNPRPKLDEEGILRAAKEMYHEMSDVTGKFMDKMLEAEAFDVTAREGKWGGGYCTSFDGFKQPFILANFNGSAGDVDVVTHEYGHGLAMDFVFDYGDKEARIGSSETAETHSMSMEFFAEKYMDKFFDNPDAYRYYHLASSLTFIPYGVIVDEFQHIVYENPDMTPSERDAAYLALEKKYRPYLDYEGLPYLSKGTRWQYQMHIYELPFYYIDYCLAQVVALEFFADSLTNYDDALARYFEHCRRGGKYPFNKLVTLAGLKSPFAGGALKETAEKVAKVLDDLRAKIKK